MIIWLLTAVFITAADQLIKYLVIKNIALTDTIEAIPGLLNFIYVKNTGAAFSILSDKTGLLSVVSVAVCVFVVFYLIKYKPKNKLYLIALGMILGDVYKRQEQRNHLFQFQGLYREARWFQKAFRAGIYNLSALF